MFHWLKIWHVLLHLAFANSLGNTDEAAMTILCLCPVHSLTFSVSREGEFLAVFTSAVFQKVIWLCQHLVLANLVFCYKRVCIHISWGFSLLFSVYSEVDRFFICLWPYGFLLLWSRSFFCCVVLFLLYCSRILYTFWILVFSWFYICLISSPAPWWHSYGVSW